MGNKKKEALTQFNKDNILSAARKLFETNGIANTTVDAIAKEADYSKSTIYVYFKSKEEILCNIIYEQMVILKDMLGKCMNKSVNFEDTYYEICKVLVKFQEKYPVYYDVMLSEIKVTKQDIAEQNISAAIYDIGEEINDLIEKLLKKGIDCGFIKDNIELIPTVFYLWSGISETIRFADRKQEYLKMRLGINKTEYMNYGFKMLLQSIKK